MEYGEAVKIANKLGCSSKYVNVVCYRIRCGHKVYSPMARNIKRELRKIEKRNSRPICGNNNISI